MTQQLVHPAWPEAGDRPVVFLLDASSRFERRLLERWIDEHRPQTAGTLRTVTIPPSRRRRRLWSRPDRRLVMALSAQDDPLLVPLRVVWLAAERGGIRAVRLSDLLKLGDPRDPDTVRQRWIAFRNPDRARIVAGEPALLSDLRAAWSDTGAQNQRSLVDFIVLRATLALERAERSVRGNRYKVPRFIREAITTRRSFQVGLARMAEETGRSLESVARQANRYLREIAATHSPYVIDLVAHLIRLLYSQGYRQIDYDPQELRAIYQAAERDPLIFLPSHKSYLDHLVLQYALYENDLPPNHTAGGINMSFFPVGLLVRRAGVFFIRRTFKDNPVYKFAVRQYIHYLIEKRFSLEWYIEGRRSRSGKLLAPRFGLLRYVTDAWRDGAADDVILIPVAIAYDQLQDVGDYAAEQRGEDKRPESFGKLIDFVRSMRKRYGSIHMRFGEPLSVAASAAASRDGEGVDPLLVEKMAFEVSVRINRVTPITPTSLVTLALLGSGERALSLEQVIETLGNYLTYVERRDLPTTRELALDQPDAVRAALDQLVDHGVVEVFDEGPDAVYSIPDDRAHAAAYYRNSIIHFFVNGAIAELALLAAAEPDVSDPVETFWEETRRLRDLLKFEFFFSDKATFAKEMREELAFHDPEWESGLAAGGTAIRRILTSIHPFSAHWVLRPFLDAYAVVADELARSGPEIDDGRFMREALALGKQYYLQGRIATPESVSSVLFESGLALARNRGLLDPDTDDLADARRAFAEEIEDAQRRVAGVEALAASRRAGLID